jgi:hypothetical protein
MPDILSGLEAYATEELIAELYARYDCVVFAGLRDLSKQDQETDCGFAGGAVVARGLVADLQDYIAAHQRVRQERHDLADWDEEDA